MLSNNSIARILFCLIITLLVSGINFSAAAEGLPPGISSEYPMHNSIGVEINPTLTAEILDPEGDSVDWTVQLLNLETSWEIIASGTEPDGRISLSIPTTTITQFDYDYSWKVTATDPSGSEQTIEESYSFRTKEDRNYPPFVRHSNPINNSVDIPLNPTLQANIVDMEGDSFTWRVELWTGSRWDELDSDIGSGEITVNVPTTAITSYDTEYSWRVYARESSGQRLSSTTRFYFTTKPENHMPDITNIIPADQSTDVSLSPTLSADIIDVENDQFSWTIEIQDGNDWLLIGSGDSTQPASAIASIVDEYETDYTWRINATDTGSENTNMIVSSFSSRKEKYAPAINNVTPFDGQLAVSIFNDPNNAGNPAGTYLSAYIEDKDGEIMNVTFSWFNSDIDNWEVLDTQKNTTKNFRTSNGWTEFAKAMTTFRWKVSAVDPTGLYDEKEFIFTTGGLLQQKFRTTFSNVGGDQIMPVMGDIDNDGTQEIVMAAGNNIVSVNGKTGEIEWSISGGANTAIELVDINNDGTPEVLHGMNGPKLRALRGDGSVIWTTPRLKGEGQGLFPIMAYDIDGDGYPTIYFAAEDQTPFAWSGNLSDYNGALSMIDHNGNILKDTWIFHPCWGGLSLGDVNYDGKFELYVSDRRARGYLDGHTSMGPHAYDAETLELLWSRPDIQHSSPIPIIADVVGDENLEVVLTPITMKGPMVVDGMTGETIYDYSTLDLPTHGVGTVYDIDEDGRTEIMLATSYPDSAPPEFAIFDLITGETEFRPVLETQVAWAPKVGNIDEDEDMEILVATGPQGWGGTYPLLIYKYDSELRNYTLIDRVDPKNVGQLMPARVYDVDSDGFNEVVLAGYKGFLIVYDTPAETPNPAPRTWLQMYSEYRQGVAEYVPPPGAPQPIIKETNIANGTINVQPNPTLSVHVIDFHYDKMDINIAISTSASGPWETVASFTDAGNGWYDFIPNSTDDRLGELNETYYWRVSARDPEADDILTTQAYSFTTTPCDQEGYVLLSYYEDNDGDGYGNPSRRLQSCMEQDSEAPEGYVFNNTDCNDGNISINPLALEICDGVDNNCAGGVDEDIDSDGFRVCNDNCPFLYNPDQKDENNNSIGDACECGNGIIDPNEECDGSDLGGKSCSTYRFNAGTLKCTAGCLIDASDCYNKRKKSSSGGGGGGGGGSSSVSSNPDEDWNCGEWSLCLNGEQTQVCTHKTMDAQKTNVKSCKTTIDDLLAASQTEDEFMDLLAKATNNVSIINKTVPKGSAVNQTSENNASANSSEVPEITGAVVGSGDGSRKPVWGLALMILGIILAIALAGYNLNKKGIKPIGKKPAYKILEDE